jgi:16S rRNA G527 N7-methylase RsmG
MSAEPFDWEGAIAARAARSGLDLPATSVRALSGHAREVLRANAELSLTTITEPVEFVERHLGEAFEGAAMLEPGVSGTMLDLGSGNGYPALPFALARPGLRPLLTDASRRRAAFLRELVGAGEFPGAAVLEAHVQRAADLFDVGAVRVVTTRAMGGWAKIVPRLASCLTRDADVLVWAGEEMERVSTRVAWRRFALVERRLLPGRDRSWVFRLRPA